jgi:hypothetical protein
MHAAQSFMVRKTKPETTKGTKVHEGSNVKLQPANHPDILLA